MDSDLGSDNESNECAKYMVRTVCDCPIVDTLDEVAQTCTDIRLDDPQKWIIVLWIPDGDTRQCDKLPTAIGSELLYVHLPDNAYIFDFVGSEFRNGPMQLVLISTGVWSDTHPCQHTPITYKDICLSSEDNTPSPQAS